MTLDGVRFDAALFEKARRESGLALGTPLSAVAETGSTNDDALAAATGGAPSGALFVADAQTHGRGRRGHTWTSPAGENLMFSLLLRPEFSPDRASALSLVSGLAVRAAAARRVESPIYIKWPNDIIVGTKKLAGVLVESRLRGADVEAVVIGIGINVHMVDVPDEIASVATSLALLGDPSPSRELLLLDILIELQSRLEVFGGQGLVSLTEELRVHDGLMDVPVRVGDVEGTAMGIAEDGALLVRDLIGRVQRVSAGTVERIPG